MPTICRRETVAMNIERKKRSTSGGNPQFPNGFSRTLLFYLIDFQPKSPEGKHPTVYTRLLIRQHDYMRKMATFFLSFSTDLTQKRLVMDLTRNKQIKTSKQVDNIGKDEA